MRISFNGLLLTEQSTGMRTYMVGLLSGLKELDTSDEWIVYVRPGVTERLSLPQWSGCRYVEIPVAGSLPGRLIAEMVGLPMYDSRNNVDVSFSPTIYLPLNQRIPSVVTLVDFCWLRVPEGYSFGQRLSFQLRFDRSLFRSSGIVTISETMRRDLLQKYKDRLHTPVTAMPLGVEQSLFQSCTLDPSPVRARWGLRDRIILSSGGTNARKDIYTLARAFAQLPPSLADSLQIVVIGPYDEEPKAYILNTLPDDYRARFIFTGFVSVSEKMQLFSMASLFVFPTLDEGFGLPVLESMAAGVPVICSNIDVLQEVGGKTVRLFGRGNASALATEMQAALDRPSEAAQLAVLAQERARTFSWDASGRKLLSLIYEVHASYPPKVVPTNSETCC